MGFSANCFVHYARRKSGKGDNLLWQRIHMARDGGWKKKETGSGWSDRNADSSKCI